MSFLLWMNAIKMCKVDIVDQVVGIVDIVTIGIFKRSNSNMNLDRL